MDYELRIRKYSKTIANLGIMILLLYKKMAHHTEVNRNENSMPSWVFLKLLQQQKKGTDETQMTKIVVIFESVLMDIYYTIFSLKT